MSGKDRIQELELIRKALEGLAQNQGEKYSATYERGDSDPYELTEQGLTANRTTRESEMTNLLVDSKIATFETKIVEILSDIQSDFMEKYSELTTKLAESRPNYLLLFLGTIVGIVLAIVALLYIIFPVYNENYWLNHKADYLEEIKKALQALSPPPAK